MTLSSRLEHPGSADSIPNELLQHLADKPSGKYLTNPQLSIEHSMKILERYWMFLPCAPSCSPWRTWCCELALSCIWEASLSGSDCLQACIGAEKPCPHGVSLLGSASHFSWSHPSLKIWSSTAQVMCLWQGAWEKLWGGSPRLSWQKRKPIQTLGSKRTAWLVTSGFDERSAQELNSCFKQN